MEEIASGVQSGNVCSIAAAVGKLIEILKKEDLKAAKKSEGLSYLLKQTFSPDPSVSLTCGEALAGLMISGRLDVPSTMIELYSSITGTCNTSGVVRCLSSLVSQGLRSTSDDLLSFRKSQQPLVVVLKQKPDSWPHILAFTNQMLFHETQLDQRQVLDVLHPIFHHVLCSPSASDLVAMRYQLWSSLITLIGSDCIALSVFRFASQMQDDTTDRDFVLSSLLNCALADNNSTMTVALLPSLSSLLLRQVQTGANIAPTLGYLQRALFASTLTADETATMGSVVIATMLDVVPKCPPIHFSSLITLCDAILEHNLCGDVLHASFLSCVFPWMAQPSLLTQPGLHIASGMINRFRHKQRPSPPFKLPDNEYLTALIATDLQSRLSLETARLGHDLRDFDAALDWLSRLQDGSGVPLVLGLFLTPTDTRVSLSALQMLKKAADDDMSVILMSVLYRLSGEDNPVLNLELMHFLPSFAKNKDFLPVVLKVTEEMGQSTFLKPMRLRLLCEIWKVNPRAYPYLKTQLDTSESDWEFDVARAAVIKEVCEARPHQCGPEMLSYLSRILTESEGDKGRVQASLAIKGIACLLREGIFTAHSMWKVLGRNLTGERRPFVFKSVCHLLALIPKSSPSNEHTACQKEVLQYLWTIAADPCAELSSAAIRALASFPMSDFTMQMLPGKCLEDVKLPVDFSRGPAAATDNPQDILDYIPGQCWIKLLDVLPREVRPDAVHLLAGLIGEELEGLPRAAFNLQPGRRIEPALYTQLKPNSVLKAITSTVYDIAECRTTFEADILLQVLCAVETDLPPFDWSLLERLQQTDDIWEMCVRITAKQCRKSDSARRVAEKKLGSAGNVSRIEVVFRCLPHLCSGMPASIIGPFLDTHVQDAAVRAIAGDTQLLRLMLTCMSEALRSDDSDDKNKAEVNSVIVKLIDVSWNNPAVWDMCMSCISSLSADAMEKLTAMSMWWESTPEKVEKAVRIRCKRAMDDENDPFSWLPECINAIAVQPSENAAALRQINEVLRKHCNHDTNRQWLTKIMGDISSVIESRSKLELPSADDVARALTFLCDVFALSVASMSRLNYLNITVATFNEPNRLVVAICTLDLIPDEQMRNFCRQVGSAGNLPEAYSSTFRQSFLLISHRNGLEES